MTATPDDLRKRATRLRRGVGQLGMIEAIIDAATGPWLGAMDADGRGTAELRMHLAGRYRLTAVVTSAGKLNLVQMQTPAAGPGAERVLSSKPQLRRGWEPPESMPKQPDWLDHVVDWVARASADVDRRAVIEWHLTGTDRKLAAMDDTIDSLRVSLREREQLRDELAAEVAELRAELESLGTRAEPGPETTSDDEPASPETAWT
ncbi:hypothetical protein [Nocardia sp. BMG51109]|uniref:hypothetical protein n=1 Tax=Nocardia sp. BMG51109 TaxID=1056816 RepID=UPI0012EB7546|nr:hypothetical protein [Nocardia sp. BMG51109]